MTLTSRSTDNSVRIDWQTIDAVLLDMDGTLLDLRYDNLVWNELVPQAYADQAGLSADTARQRLLEHMQKIRGTIEYYSFEYWSSFTQADLMACHWQAVELLCYRPNALSFLRWLKRNNCPSFIATNAHRDSLHVKDSKMGICGEVDGVISSQDYGIPKEDVGFWQALFKQVHADPARCLFIDDNIPVLNAAADHGVGHLLAIKTPDSNTASRDNLGYPSFDDFADLMPLEAS